MNTCNYYQLYFKKFIFNTILVFICAQLFAQNQQEIQIANEYLNKGEKTKALTAFQTLAKDFQNIPPIHNNYLNLMLDLNQYKQAEDYVEKIIKKDDRITYRLDLGFVYARSGDLTKADKYFKSIIKIQHEDVYKAKIIADYLTSKNLTDYAVYSLLQARNVKNSPALFALELANLYRIQGKRNEMVNEYLDYVTQTPANSAYIKNLMQLLITKPEEQQSLEQILLDRVQRYPQSEIYADLIIWVNLQQKNFYGAFIQSRAYDKRFRKENSKTLEIAQIALNNKDYSNADKAFSYVIKEFVNTENYLPAQLGLIRTREAKVKKSYPVNKDSVRYLISEYDKFCARYPENQNTYEARLNQSLLKGYYLNEIDSAIKDLSKLIANPKVSLQLKNQAKIELGDVYLLKGEPWEATLLYSQVEKSQRETPLGYDAKLRNAKLSYYKGDFKLAQEHLDILKQATTREIANDAMDLSMRIKENTTFDTTGISLRQFAHIELLIYQNKMEMAQKQLQNFENGKVLMKQAEAFLYGLIDVNTLVETEGEYIWVTLPASRINKEIMDDYFWLQANLNLKQGKFQESISFLEKIITQFPDDVYADDAFFMQGDIYQTQLGNKEKASEIFRAFLNKFPGSVYAAEARKRYRALRGDFAEEKGVN